MGIKILSFPAKIWNPFPAAQELLDNITIT
jgi:hypothetical protein